MSKSSVEAGLQELEQFSGLESELVDLHARLRDDISAWKEEIESVSERKTKLSLLKDYEEMTQRLHKAVLVARNAARQKAAKMNREELMSLSKKRSTKPLTQEDMVGQEVTASLKRMLETMRTEVDRSAKNIATAKSSSTAICGTAANYRSIDSKLDDTRGLIRDLKKKDRGDKFFVLGAFGVLLGTVAFIVFQRSPEVVKLPARLAFERVQEFVHFEGNRLLEVIGNFRDARKFGGKFASEGGSLGDAPSESVSESEGESVSAETAMSAAVAVTFAEYDSDPLILQDRQILIELTESETWRQLTEDRAEAAANATQFETFDAHKLTAPAVDVKPTGPSERAERVDAAVESAESVSEAVVESAESVAETSAESIAEPATQSVVEDAASVNELKSVEDAGIAGESKPVEVVESNDAKAIEQVAEPKEAGPVEQVTASAVLNAMKHEQMESGVRSESETKPDASETISVEARAESIETVQEYESPAFESNSAKEQQKKKEKEHQKETEKEKEQSSLSKQVESDDAVSEPPSHPETAGQPKSNVAESKQAEADPRPEESSSEEAHSRQEVESPLVKENPKTGEESAAENVKSAEKASAPAQVVKPKPAAQPESSSAEQQDLHKTADAAINQSELPAKDAMQVESSAAQVKANEEPISVESASQSEPSIDELLKSAADLERTEPVEEQKADVKVESAKPAAAATKATEQMANSTAVPNEPEIETIAPSKSDEQAQLPEAVEPLKQARPSVESTEQLNKAKEHVAPAEQPISQKPETAESNEQLKSQKSENVESTEQLKKPENHVQSTEQLDKAKDHVESTEQPKSQKAENVEPSKQAQKSEPAESAEVPKTQKSENDATVKQPKSEPVESNEQSKPQKSEKVEPPKQAQQPEKVEPPKQAQKSEKVASVEQPTSEPAESNEQLQKAPLEQVNAAEKPEQNNPVDSTGESAATVASEISIAAPTVSEPNQPAESSEKVEATSAVIAAESVEDGSDASESDSAAYTDDSEVEELLPRSRLNVDESSNESDDVSVSHDEL